MERLLQFALAGTSGSGKTSLTDALVAKYGLKKSSAGGTFVNIAKGLGVDLGALEEKALTEPKYDLMIDQGQREFARTHAGVPFIVESRRALEEVPEVVPTVIPILLLCGDVRFGRIFNRPGEKEKMGWNTAADAEEYTTRRERLMDERFMLNYQQTLKIIFDPKRFVNRFGNRGIICYTEFHTTPELVEQIERRLKHMGF